MSRAGRRGFWCRHHLWHSWESKRVALIGSREPVSQMWVCRRCKMGTKMVPSFANGGFLKPGSRVIVGDGDGCYMPLGKPDANASIARWLEALARRES